MNKNKVILSISIIVLIVLSVISFKFITNYNSENNNSNSDNNLNNENIDKEENQVSDEKEENSDENSKVENSDEMLLEFKKTLSSYTQELYENKTYLNLKQDDANIYYATKGDLKNMGYDISKIDPNCGDDDKIIMFKPNEKGEVTREKGSIMIMYSCQDVLAQDNN